MAAAEEQQNEFQRQFSRQNVPRTTAILQGCTVGIMGAGGLGSNVAAALVRSGVGRLIIADFDRVELSNLNRQLFFHDQVGRPKVEALGETLGRINPYVRLDLQTCRVTPDNLGALFSTADLLVEALDRAQEKARLIEAWLTGQPTRSLVAASGLAGFGDWEDLVVRRKGRLYLCGDGRSDAAMGLCAGRVGTVAHMQANLTVTLLLKERGF